jgi:hypothetical protein
VQQGNPDDVSIKLGLKGFSPAAQQDETAADPLLLLAMLRLRMNLRRVRWRQCRRAGRPLVLIRVLLRALLLLLLLLPRPGP